MNVKYFVDSMEKSITFPHYPQYYYYYYRNKTYVRIYTLNYFKKMDHMFDNCRK